MAPYFLTFALSCSLFFASEHASDSNRAFKHSLTIMAIAVPCILAGARDSGVGTDTALYGKWLIEAVGASSDIIGCLNAAAASAWKLEPLFVLQGYVSIKMFGTAFAYYFIIELLILAPVYLAVKRLSGGRNVWLAMLLYYLLFYALSLNMMRQSMAISFLLLAFSFLCQKKTLIALLCVAVSYLFHRTGIVGIVVLLAYLLIFERESAARVTRKITPLVISVSVIILVAAMIDPVRILAAVSNVLGSSYDRYLSSSYGQVSEGIAFYAIYGAIAFFLLMLAFQERKIADPNMVFIHAIVCVAFALYSFGAISTPLTRLAYFPLEFMVVGLAYALKDATSPLRVHSGLVYLFVAASAGGWWFYVEKGFNDAVPYVSGLFGIGL